MKSRLSESVPFLGSTSPLHSPPTLQVGVQHALSIAARHRLPVVPVHHMEAHTLMTRLPSANPMPTTFPALVLLVSGGHNMLVLSEGVGRHRIIGTTLDDR